MNNRYTLFALCCLVSAEVTSFLSYLILALYPVQVHVMSRRPSRQMSAFSAEGLGEHIYEGDGPRRPSVQSVVQASSLKPGAQLTMERFLQDLPSADQPPVDFNQQYHTGRVPNSKGRDGKPRLLLMGQRR